MMEETSSGSGTPESSRTQRQEASQQLKDDLHHLSRTVEELVNATADDSRQNVKEMRARAEKRLQDTRSRLESRGEHAYHEARDHVTRRADSADRYVHDNPWTSIGIGAAAGVVIGLLIGRR
ncbi:membrane protein [Halomonas halmophila]|uniref:Membrane protein n=2 Tax=Halomonas halmophila TaxID=252 RepID=A0A4Y4EX57_9GAMM|nr:membrane protein [Halomonas halmophila]